MASSSWPFLAGGGEMGALMRAHDWASTPLGSPDTWPQPLRCMVATCLNSPLLGTVLWGSELRMLYNDAYIPSMGERHPAALGRPIHEVWGDAWSEVSRPFLNTMATGEGFERRDVRLNITRHGKLETTWWDFSAAPIRDEAGCIVGLLHQGVETTAQVRALEASKAAEERYALALAAGGGIGAWDWEVPSDRVIADDQFARLYGVDPAEAARGVPIAEFFRSVHPEDRQRLNAAIVRSLATGAEFAEEYRITGAASGERWVAARGRAHLDANGRPTRFPGVSFDITARQRSKAALASSEARNRQILDSAIDYAIIATDLDGLVTRWNEGACRVLGWTEEEMLGHPVARFFTPEDVAAGQMGKEMRVALQEGRGKDERWHLRKDGERFWASGEITVLRNEAGAATGFVKVLRDRTEQRLAEETLRASEARLSAIVRATSEVLYSQSPDWSEMRQLTGGGFLADTGTANPHWLAEYIPADEQPRVTATIAEAIRTRSIFSLEHRVRLADGGVGWTQSRAVPLLGPDGEITEWFGTASDVTARRQAEEALRQLNETLEQEVVERTAERNRLWNASPDLLLISDFQGVFRRVNPAWTKLLGYRPNELVNHHVNEFVVPEDNSITTEAYELAARGGSPRIENRYRHKDGSTRWISWVAASVGDLTYATGRDVTGEKAAAKQLADTQEALRQSQKMEAVGQLTGGLAHDFNNLLTGITGSLELLQIRIAQGRIKEVDRYVNAAQGAAKRAASLTHRLLAFSRRQTLDPRPTDVNRLVRGMEELVARTVGPEITVEPMVGGAGLWSTLVDPGQLENALLNLCINARDAMPDGGKLTIETGNRWMDERTARDRDLQPGQYVSLCVSDTGTGMAPEVIARAFDPFFTTKPIGQGTGLGLSMIYGFVRQSGGHVRIYSEIGQGTMVCLYLPRHLDGEAAPELSPDLRDAPRAEAGQAVLVVDDEPTVRMLVTEVLEDLGYTAIEAADGAAALKVLGSDARIDLLVTDVGLPGGMNGRQVAEMARVARPGLTVLFITGYAENAVLSHGHLDPGMHVLTKPFAMETLASRIKELISDGGG